MRAPTVVTVGDGASDPAVRMGGYVIRPYSAITAFPKGNLNEFHLPYQKECIYHGTHHSPGPVPAHRRLRRQEIEVGGWVRSIRASKAFGFIVLSDGTYFNPLQVVYHDTMENFQAVSKLNVGTALIVKGTLVETPDAKQPFELQATAVTVEGRLHPGLSPSEEAPLPGVPADHDPPAARTNTFQAVFRVRSLIAYAIHQFFQERDFVYVHTPLITGSDCEGAGEMFQVTTLDLNNLPRTEDGKVDFTQDFFNKPTNLTVSGQLNGETFAMAFRNIYTFGPPSAPRTPTPPATPPSSG